MFGHDYDKLKRIGHLVRVPLELSVWDDYDKLKRIGHLVHVPFELSVWDDYDKLMTQSDTRSTRFRKRQMWRGATSR